MYINPKRWIRGKIKKLTMAAINFTHLGNEKQMRGACMVINNVNVIKEKNK